MIQHVIAAGVPAPYSIFLVVTSFLKTEPDQPCILPCSCQGGPSECSERPMDVLGLLGQSAFVSESESSRTRQCFVCDTVDGFKGATCRPEQESSPGGSMGWPFQRGFPVPEIIILSCPNFPSNLASFCNVSNALS